LLCKKSKESKTSEAAAVLESPMGLEERSLDKKVKSSQLPLTAVSIDICQLYPERKTSIWKHPGQRRWMQWTNTLLDSQILGVMSDEGRGLLRGCYWGGTTRHGVLDVDINSHYHTVQGLRQITDDLAEVGLNLIPYRSSESGGWHLYLPFDSDVLSKEVETTIKDYLRLRGYQIASGTLEVFPSGNALRLPLQTGFAWLTPDGVVKTKREHISQNEAITTFLMDLERSAANWQEVKTRIETEIYSAGAGVAGNAQDAEEWLNDEGFTGLFKPGLDWEKYQRGRQYWLTGLTADNQRHDAILCIGHYLWYGDQPLGLQALPGRRNKERRYQLIKETLREKHNGRSEDINKERWSEVEGDILRAASWTKETPLVKEYEPYQLTERLLKRLDWLHKKTGKLWTIDELEKANIDRSLDARQRIALAVAQLEAEGSEIDIAKVSRRAKACHKTVAKNRDLLCSRGSEYIAGGVGGLRSSPDFLGGSFGTFPVPTGSDRPVSVLDPVPSGGESVDPRSVSSGDSLVVVPLFHAWQESQSEIPQSSVQVVPVLSESLTLGPWLSGIQALPHETAGELSLSPGVLDLGAFRASCLVLPRASDFRIICRTFCRIKCRGFFRVICHSGRQGASGALAVGRGPPGRK
jgi:hypothetical protein